MASPSLLRRHLIFLETRNIVLDVDNHALLAERDSLLSEVARLEALVRELSERVALDNDVEEVVEDARQPSLPFVQKRPK
tara:strand:- start:202 stop:441 length:240 start_codon:yes stop_codon:yes gene_type:complete